MLRVGHQLIAHGASQGLNLLFWPDVVTWEKATLREA